MSERTQEFLETTIWYLSIMCGVAIAIFTVIKGGGLVKALLFGILGVIAFMGISLFIYLTIYSKLTLKEDGE